ncbi:MAG TPA: lysyl oxidase family protein [Candidatus Limnocylindria bacterium]|nr:lysyl oxidase family protein [Candidatus Limnocylindria bacterium]
MAGTARGMAALGVLCAASLAHGGASGLPDLVGVIDPAFKPTVQRGYTVDPGDVAEGCAKAVTGNTVVHFALSTFNEGGSDLVLGDPGCPDCALFPGPTCTNELFECSPLAGHGHPHFTKYALYEIVTAPDAPAAAAGHKQSFCIEDTLCPEGKTPIYDCFNQGLQLGCQDLYPPFALGCQYVDVTDLPGGRYLLRTTVNYEQLLPESNYDNNVDLAPVDVCEGIDGPRVRIGVRGRKPGAWRWKIAGRTTVRPPLMTADPFRDGAWVRLVDLGGDGPMDNRTLVAVEIPGRPGNQRCKRGDGWRRTRGSRTSVYANASGFVDGDCTVPTHGLRRFTGALRVRTRDGVPEATVAYVIAGTSEGSVPAGRLRVELGLGTETGPCWTATTACDGQSRACTGEPAAEAFRE